jgi:hypothetical protein
MRTATKSERASAAELAEMCVITCTHAGLGMACEECIEGAVLFAILEHETLSAYPCDQCRAPLTDSAVFRTIGGVACVICHPCQDDLQRAAGVLP